MYPAINAIEMGMDAVAHLQGKFFEKYPRPPAEEAYNFATQSTIKPTRMHALTSSINQIPGECTIEGKIT